MSLWLISDHLQSLIALNRMEDSGFRSMCDKEQEKEKVHLRVAAWARCKESNIGEEGQNLVCSPAAPPEKGLKREELKKENETREVQKFLTSSCSVEGLKEGKPTVWCEGENLRKRLWLKGNNLVGVVTPKIASMQDVKEEVKFGKEKPEQKWETPEQKWFKFEDSKDHGEEIEDETDEMEFNEADEDVRDIIAGKAYVHFRRLKSLMEHGHLKKKDLAKMRNARVVQVPGKGEVVQFLTSSRRDFNKINLKELGLNDVKVVGAAWGRRIFALTQLPSLIREMIRKKGAIFRCNTCRTTHADVASVENHISINHADMLTRLFKLANADRVRRAIKNLLRRMCDPGLVIEEVLIKNPDLKKKYSAKNQEPRATNRRAADLLLTLIQPGRSAGPGKGDVVYYCKSCGVNTSSSNWRKNDRWGCIWHLAYTHPAEYQNLAASLNVAPGTWLDSLLFKALSPGLIFKAKELQ